MSREARRGNGDELALRIVLVDPPVGVRFAVQQGRDDLVAVTTSTGTDVVLDVIVEARLDAGRVAVRGPLAHGPASARFLYVCSGTLAGQVDSCWSRRAKVPLAGLERGDASRVLASCELVLEARVPGRARDGGPACGTVPIAGGWVRRPRDQQINNC